MSDFEDSNSDFSSDDELDLDEAAVQITATKKEPKLEPEPESERIVISPVPEALEPVGAPSRTSDKTATMLQKPLSSLPKPTPSSSSTTLSQKPSARKQTRTTVNPMPKDKYLEQIIKQKEKEQALEEMNRRRQGKASQKLLDERELNTRLLENAQDAMKELQGSYKTLKMVRAFGNISTPDMDLYVYEQARIAQKEQLNERAKRRRLLYENRSFERSYKLGELAQAERELQRVDHVDNNPRMQDEFIREHKKRAELKQQYQNYLKEIHNQV